VKNCECGALVASYERLTALYHDLLGQESLAALLERAAEAVAELVPCSSLLIAEADIEQQVIVPLVVRGAWQEETMQMRPRFGEGLIGWAAANGRPVLANEAHLDVRAGQVAGTPDDEPEAVMCFPLISGGAVVGAFSLYREGEGQFFTEEEFQMAQRFADAMTLALANAKAREQLLYLARNDYLTGCLNRRGFHQELQVLASSAASNSLVLLLIDLDDFKNVNDLHGHGTGDQLLRQVADQLRAVAPEEAVVARLGGDEFGILFAPTSTTSTAAVAASVKRTLDPLTFVSAGKAITVTASVGLAEQAVANSPLEERLLRMADEAMYREKNDEPAGAQVTGRRSLRDQSIHETG
jgi:diguanylate cyclase (GGDEF)-like protein